MRAARRSRLTVVLALLVVFHGVYAGAAGTKCLGDFPALFRLLPGEASAEVMLAFRGYKARGRNGVIAILGSDPALDLDPTVLDDILDIFPRGVELPTNPPKTDEGLFEVVAELTDVLPDGTLRMRDGLADTIKDLGNRGASEDAVAFYQGAAFDLYMARQIRSAGSDVAELQRRLPVGSTGSMRVADLVEPCSLCPPVGFIQHENKNWSSALGGASDVRLVGLSSQFQRDIVIHAGSGMETWRLNLRVVALENKNLIRDELVKQFQSPFVTTNLTASQIDSARSRFLMLWENGTIVNFY